MLLAVSLRRVGAVVALLGIGCLLVALVLPWSHFVPDLRVPSMANALPEDYSVLYLLVAPDRQGSHHALAVIILYLLPLLGSCCVAIEGLRAWQGSVANRSTIALLLLGMGSALLGRATSPLLVQAAATIYIDGPVMLVSAGPGVRLASLGFGAAATGGVLLAVGAFLHHWTLRRSDHRASSITIG